MIVFRPETDQNFQLQIPRQNNNSESVRTLKQTAFLRCGVKYIWDGSRRSNISLSLSLSLSHTHTHTHTHALHLIHTSLIKLEQTPRISAEHLTNCMVSKHLPWPLWSPSPDEPSQPCSSFLYSPCLPSSPPTVSFYSAFPADQQQQNHNFNNSNN